MDIKSINSLHSNHFIWNFSDTFDGFLFYFIHLRSEEICIWSVLRGSSSKTWWYQWNPAGNVWDIVGMFMLCKHWSHYIIASIICCWMTVINEPCISASIEAELTHCCHGSNCKSVCVSEWSRTCVLAIYFEVYECGLPAAQQDM